MTIPTALNEIMFKNIDTAINASANTQAGSSSGQTRQNDDVNNNIDEINTITTKEVLADEETEAPSMYLESQLEAEGFADKSFQMSEMLQRPQILTATPIIWSSTNAVADIVATISFPDTLSIAPFFSQKMANFAAIHAEMEIEIKINPTPFQQGALAVILHPAGYLTDRIEAWTYFPHELINMPLNNSATVSIPYFAETEAYNKDDAVWEISLMVISPLRSAATPFSLEVNAFGRFVNPQLMIPVAQANVKKRSKNTELKDQETGMVTKLTGIAADVLETSGTALSMIPVVGQFIPPLTWAARATNKIAAYFGWCKPPNMEICTLMAPIPAARMCHAEGVDNGIPLTLAPDNTTNTNNNYTEVDEMDLSYLLERKFISTVESYSVGSDFRVYSLDMIPVNTPTNILNIFKHRRWMRVFEFHFVKTNFHTGRLLIQYDYNNTINNTVDARVAMSTVYSKIVDLSKQDRFTFTVPWMDINPFADQSPGRIVVSTFNDIVAAETVSQTLDIITYTSYRDVQVGFPTTTNFFPQAQGDCCGNSAPIPTDPLIPYSPQSMVEHTMGETVSSLRLLAKRFTFERIETLSASSYVLPRAIDNSMFALINKCYYGRAGGVRYKFHFPRNTQLLVTIDVDAAPSVDGRATQIFNGFMNNVAEIALPFYYPRRRSFSEYPWPDITLKLLDESGNIIAGNINTYIAAGDDYNGMFLNGISPLAASLSQGYYGITSTNEPTGFGKVFGTLIRNNGEWVAQGQNCAIQGLQTVPEQAGMKLVVLNFTSGDYEFISWPDGEVIGAVGSNSINLPRISQQVFDDGQSTIEDTFFADINLPFATIAVNQSAATDGTYLIAVTRGQFNGDLFVENDDYWVMTEETDPTFCIVWNGTTWDIRKFSVDGNTFVHGTSYASSIITPTLVTESVSIWGANIIEAELSPDITRNQTSLDCWATGLGFTDTTLQNIQTSGEHVHFFKDQFLNNYFMFMYDIHTSTWIFYHPNGRSNTFSTTSTRVGRYLVPSNTLSYTQVVP